MKTPKSFPGILIRRWIGAAALWGASWLAAAGQGETLLDDLISYWPLDEIQGTKTPDLKSSYDFNLNNMTEADLVPGKYGQAFRFNGIDTYLARMHGASDDLPANKHNSFTISFWARVNGRGQNDKRMFSEASGGTDPLFNLGTHQTGANGAVDVYIRQAGMTVINHIQTVAEPLDVDLDSGELEWRHILFWQQENEDGSSSRRIYIDGFWDFLFIPDKAAGFNFSMDRTSIGAILRSGPSAFVMGEIDDVAIWKRTLTDEEITDLYENGMPDLDAAVEPLAINIFEADYGSAVEGGKVRLRWDVTKDATITLIRGTDDPVDVTGVSAFGVGSMEVDIAGDESFVLNVSRDGEELDASLQVVAVPDVVPGWSWVEDFENRNLGNLVNQPRWLVSQGSVEVRDFAQTRVAGVTAGNDLAGLALRDLGIAPGTRRTLFFRFHQSSADADLPVDIRVGLTEKSLRNAEDFNTNAGTLIRFFRAADGELVLRARSGPDEPAANFVEAVYDFLPDVAYNVWIDIQNHPLNSGNPDTFSVHLAPQGGPRTTVFDNLISDRLPTEVPILGFPRENIDTLLIAAVGPDQASQAVLLDDFYISTADTWNSSVPVAGTQTGSSPGSFMITAASRNADGSASLTWNSEAGTRYYIQVSPDLVMWNRIDEVGVVADSEVTSVVLPGPFIDPKMFFRVEQ